MFAMKSSVWFFLILSLSFEVVPAQVNKTRKKDTVLKGQIWQNDTLPHIELKEIAILPPRHFKNRWQERRYWRLVYNLKKVLPYSKIVSATIQDVDRHLVNIKTDKERRNYIHRVEDSLWGVYEQDMRKMTVTQGKLLFKLVDRQTSKTTYYWIDHYRGSFSAFFWQAMARLFGSNLKSAYDPQGKDRLIEELVGYIERGLI